MQIQVDQYFVDFSKTIKVGDIPIGKQQWKTFKFIEFLFLKKVLTELQFKIYSIIFNLSYNDNKYAHLSLWELATLFKIRRATIVSTLKELEELQLLTIERPTFNNKSSKITNSYHPMVFCDFLEFNVLHHILNTRKVKEEQILTNKMNGNERQTPKNSKKTLSFKNKGKENHMHKIKKELKKEKNSGTQRNTLIKKLFSSSKKNNTDFSGTKNPNPVLPSAEGGESRFARQGDTVNKLPVRRLKSPVSDSNQISPAKRQLKSPATCPKIINSCHGEATKPSDPTLGKVLNLKGLKTKNSNSFPNVCDELIPYLEYWVEKIKPLKPDTRVYKNGVTYLKQLVKGILFNNSRDPMGKIYFAPYKNRPISLEDFKLAVDNFAIIRSDPEVAPKDKKYVKSYNLDNFLLFINPNTQKVISWFIESHSWENPKDFTCHSPFLQKELIHLFVNVIKGSHKGYELTEEEIADFGKAADKLMKWVHSKPTEIVQNLFPQQYALMIYKALQMDDIPDKAIKISSFLTEATYARRLPLFLQSPDGQGYIYHKRTIEELAQEMRANQEQTLEEKIDEWERGDVITLTPDGYEIHGNDIWDNKRQIDVGYVTDDGGYHYFSEEIILKKLKEKADVNVEEEDEWGTGNNL